MHPSFSLASGFHAVVIGGAGDIGAAIANLFCDLGATVTATGGNDADIARTKLKPPPFKPAKSQNIVARPGNSGKKK